MFQISQCILINTHASPNLPFFLAMQPCDAVMPPSFSLFNLRSSRLKVVSLATSQRASFTFHLSVLSTRGNIFPLSRLPSLPPTLLVHGFINLRLGRRKKEVGVFAEVTLAALVHFLLRARA